ncbi:MAG TPA: hypothetical protein VGG89_12620 [Candidatus Baltobacteraceae bacterium]|jgi:hypothetical protein
MEAAYWAFGFILAGGIAVGIGKPLVAECGQKVIPPVAIAGALLGAALGWAINTYIAYVHASATLRP